ncbi:MAG: histidine phosphatase family protein [Spirochaetaceae bacterium]|nr:MAG: histidine phosphatase family protein [Spirochaetaceae bacterium]
MKTILIIVRHGETEWNRMGKQQGHLDSPLSENGIRQAEAIASAVRTGFDLVISSDLGRALATAEIIMAQCGLPILKDQGLRERHLGMLQGFTMEEFAKAHPKKTAQFVSGDPDFVIPEGESIRQRYDRAIRTFDRIASEHQGKRIMVVTHGGILESLLRHTLGIPLELKRSFSLINGSLNTFSYEQKWILESWGIISHLEGLRALDDF